MVVEILGGIGEGRKEQHLPIARIDGMGELLLQVGFQLLQLAVVLRRNIR